MRVGEAKIKNTLSGFTKRGIVDSTEKKAQKYYGLNSYSEDLPELTAFTAAVMKKKTKKGRDMLEKEIMKSGSFKFAALYGVFTGQVKAEADLLLVGTTGPKRLARCVKFLESMAQNEINYVVMDSEEFMQRLYSFDWFVKEILEKDSVILTDMLTKKVTAATTQKTLVRSFSNIRK